MMTAWMAGIMRDRARGGELELLGCWGYSVAWWSPVDAPPNE